MATSPGPISLYTVYWPNKANVTSFELYSLKYMDISLLSCKAETVIKVQWFSRVWLVRNMLLSLTTSRIIRTILLNKRISKSNVFDQKTTFYRNATIVACWPTSIKCVVKTNVIPNTVQAFRWAGVVVKYLRWKSHQMFVKCTRVESAPVARVSLWDICLGMPALCRNGQRI